MPGHVGERNLGEPLDVSFERADLEAEVGARRFIETLEQARIGMRMVGAVHHQDRRAGGEWTLARGDLACPGKHRVNRPARKIRAVGISERQVDGENLSAVERLPYEAIALDRAVDPAPYHRSIQPEAWPVICGICAIWPNWSGR